MLKLYEKLSEYEVVMSMSIDNDSQLVYIKFEKGLTHVYRVYTYEVACDSIRWERILLGDLDEFMFIYEQDCIKYNRAAKLKGIWEKENKNE